MGWEKYLRITEFQLLEISQANLQTIKRVVKQAPDLTIVNMHPITLFYHNAPFHEGDFLWKAKSGAIFAYKKGWLQDGLDTIARVF